MVRTSLTLQATDTLLNISNLSISFKSDDGWIRAVQDVNLQMAPGETVGLVGESGCGKSVTSLAIMGLLPRTARVEGEISLQGRNLTTLTDKELRRVRGNDVSMIFQEPMTSLNPILRIGDQIAEPLRMHAHLTSRQMSERVKELLAQVGIPNPARVMQEYPHQLSGGMRQRVMIAMAMACKPKLLIADEPTTALDVTVQAQILDLLRKLQEESGMSLLLITHDLGVVAEMCSRVTVMYAGKVVEECPVDDLYYEPEHPYTQGLLGSLPDLDKRERLRPIPGQVPPLWAMPPGCRFAPRCSRAMDICHSTEPQLLDVEPNHRVSCWLHQKGGTVS
ncbi:MAG: ABC transporter ATP-binding protein [Alicyclobacillus sp.]|nr:ABC transporter ATP-binding protein [Alicyclobacillus sp.]